MTKHSSHPYSPTRGLRRRDHAEQLARALDAAARKVAPLWPLDRFVAVNPFLGLSEQPFAQAARTLAAAAGARLTMPRGFYAEAVESGQIDRGDLLAGLEASGLALEPDELAALARTDAPPPEPLPTVADVAAAATGVDWPTIVTERVALFAAAHHDRAQASWRAPTRGERAWDAWRAEAAIDLAMDAAGLPGFRAWARRLEADRLAATDAALATVGLGATARDAYLHRLVMSIAGWAGHARHRQWERELRGERDEGAVDLLAIRLTYERALLTLLGERVGGAWADARARYVGERPADEERRAIDLALHVAYERAHQRRLAARFERSEPTPPAERPSAHAAFCIDVRSEVLRRALEEAAPSVETIGFAGFFGFPIEYVPLGRERGGPRCPALLSPSSAVREAVLGEPAEQQARAKARRQMRRRASKAWASFQHAAVSSFGFVETMGWTYAGKLVTDTLGLTRTVPHPADEGLDASVRRRLGPALEDVERGGRRFGLSAEQRIDLAEGTLRGMSLTEGHAPLVLLCGHGARVVNNPYASGLDCGACGGHDGEANARLAAAVLNEPDVRAGLRERGIEVPEDTLFLGGLHDTTTDDVTVFEDAPLSEPQRAAVERLRRQLAEAGRRARRERAPSLGVDRADDPDAAVRARGRDWSQVRPEWGLAGCTSFVVAPRHRTRGMDLGGRAFLHSYDWRADEGFAVLRLILTAPMVVASWINLQYYASTVEPRVFGSGNKVLHNVVGGLGTVEGNGGDLRCGLPAQSVHDGERPYHEPVRLSVLVEAPIEAMNDVIEEHDGVRALLDHGWLHLFAIDDQGRVARRYVGDLTWAPLSGDADRRAA